MSGLINNWLDAAFEQIAPGESQIRSIDLPPDSTGNPIFYHLKDNLTYRIPRRVLSPIEVPDGYAVIKTGLPATVPVKQRNCTGTVLPFGPSYAESIKEMSKSPRRRDIKLGRLRRKRHPFTFWVSNLAFADLKQTVEVIAQLPRPSFALSGGLPKLVTITDRQLKTACDALSQASHSEEQIPSES